VTSLPAQEANRKPNELPSVAERHRLMQAHIETNHYVDATGELYDPATLPEIYDPEGDEDSDG
jgi:hypothetical protein